MAERIPVFVYAADPLSQAGVSHQLRTRPELLLVDPDGLDTAKVAVVVAEEADEDTAQVVKAMQRNGCRRVVLVLTRVDDHGVLSAVEAGACGLLRRTEADPERLASAVIAAAAGDGTVSA